MPGIPKKFERPWSWNPPAGNRVDQAFARRGELLKVLHPVIRDATLDNRRTILERRVDEVVQAGRKQRLLKEGVDPNAEKTRIGHEILQLIDASLDCGPNEAERKSEGEHNRETNGSHQCGAWKMPSHSGRRLLKKRLWRATITPETRIAPRKPVSRVVTPPIALMPVSAVARSTWNMGPKKVRRLLMKTLKVMYSTKLQAPPVPLPHWTGRMRGRWRIGSPCC